MPYNFPRQQFDRTAYFSLNEAFHLVGSYMFPDTWTGLEIAAHKATDTQSIKAESDNLRSAYEAAEERASTVLLDFHIQTNYETREALKPILANSTRERDLAKTAHDSYLRNYDRRLKDGAAFERKQSVEAIIYNAVRTAELDTHLDFGTVHSDLINWVNSPKFCLNFSHSYLVAPNDIGNRRKFRTYFKKEQFELWAEPLTRKLSEYRTQTFSDDLIAWFKTYREGLARTSTRASQKMVLSACQETFNRAGEGERLDRQIEAVWLLYAPAGWKKGGAPKT